MFATPDDLGNVPPWLVYVHSQLTAASLGSISSRIVVIAFKEKGTEVTLAFYVDPPLTDDYREIAQIMEDFDDLTGNILDVRVEVKEWQPAVVDREFVWTYRRWLGVEAFDTESTGRVDELKVRRIAN